VHRSNELRLPWIVSKGTPKVADQDVEARGIDMAVGPEDRIQLVFFQDLRPSREQGRQQVECLPRQVNFLAAAMELPRRRVERERSESNLHEATTRLGNPWLFLTTRRLITGS
jgi:hypothetical protein